MFRKSHLAIKTLKFGTRRLIYNVNLTLLKYLRPNLMTADIMDSEKKFSSKT
jgi:hypothetical protein